MSRTTLYVFDSDGDAETLAEYQNSWRSAPMIWNYLLVSLGLLDPSDPAGSLKWGLLWGADPKGNLFASMLGAQTRTPEEQEAREARSTANMAKMSDDEWWVYITTCDRYVVAPECAGDLVEALRMVQVKVDAFNKGQSGDDILPASFAEQADTIARATDVEPATTGLRGFAWNQSSVSCVWPEVPIHAFDTDACPCDDNDEDTGDCDYVPPNMDRDGGFWLVTGLRQREWIDRQHDHANPG